MSKRFSTVLAAALAAALISSLPAGAAMVGIYRNRLDSTAQRAQLVKLAGGNCARGGGGTTLKVTIGKRTEACSFRTPVLGRDLEIAATERLLSGTPKPLQRKAYLSLELRAGGGAKYQMLLFPLQRKVQLLKTTAGKTKYLAIAKNLKGAMGINKANVLRLRAVNATSGPEKGHAKLLAYLGSSLVAEAEDAGAGELSGRASAVVAGAPGNADGVVASFDDVSVRVPSPF